MLKIYFISTNNSLWDAFITFNEDFVKTNVIKRPTIRSGIGEG